MSRASNEEKGVCDRESMLPIHKRWAAVLVDPATAHAEEVLEVKTLLDHDAIFHESVYFVALFSSEPTHCTLIGAMALTRVHPLSKSLLARLCKVNPDAMMQQLDHSFLPGVEINYHLYGLYLMLKAVIEDPRIEHGTAFMIQVPATADNSESRIESVCGKLAMGTTFDAGNSMITAVRTILREPSATPKREFDTIDVKEDEEKEESNKKAKVEDESSSAEEEDDDEEQSAKSSSSD